MGRSHDVGIIAIVSHWKGSHCSGHLVGQLSNCVTVALCWHHCYRRSGCVVLVGWTMYRTHNRSCFTMAHQKHRKRHGMTQPSHPLSGLPPISSPPSQKVRTRTHFQTLHPLPDYLTFWNLVLYRQQWSRLSRLEQRVKRMFGAAGGRCRSFSSIRKSLDLNLNLNLSSYE